jgi:uncharacterized protein (TIGR02996 family)
VSKGAALLEAVYRHPTDSQARRVYADWLLEQGDPRAEFIILQLVPPTPGGKARAAQLFAQHGAGWVGGLGPVLERVTVADFERGFLARCWASFTSLEQAAALAKDPAWSTVREAVTSLATQQLKPKNPRSRIPPRWVYERAPVPPFLAAAPLNALEHFTGTVPLSLAASLASRATPFSSLRELAVDLTEAGLKECRALANATAFPALEKLTLTSDERRAQMLAPCGAILHGRLGGQPLSVTISPKREQLNPAGEMKSWLGLMRDAPGVRALSLPGNPTLDFERGPGGWVLQLSNLAAANEAVLKQLAEVKPMIVAVRADMRSVSALAISPLRSRLKPVPVEQS